MMVTARTRPLAYVIAGGLAVMVCACGSQEGGEQPASETPAPFTRDDVEAGFSAAGIPLVVGLDLEGRTPVDVLYFPEVDPNPNWQFAVSVFMTADLASEHLTTRDELVRNWPGFERGADYAVIRNENVVAFYRRGSAPDRLAKVESAMKELDENAD